MDGEGRQVLGQTGRSRGELHRELAHQRPQAALSLLGARGLIERGPVGRSDPLVKPRAFGQLGQDVAQSMHAAALAIGIGPQLTDGADETGRPIADHEQRAAQAPGAEPPPRSSQSSSRSRWPRQTSSSTRSPSVVKPQATSTPSLGPSGRTGR